MPEAEPRAILVVEDEASIRRGLCDVLAYHGYVPEPVERCDEGLRRALAGDHARILLDIMLPGLSGFEVCRQLREVRPQLPILMLTARGSEDDVLEGFRAGSDDYVTKPFSLAELLARIEALLRRSDAGAPEPVETPFAFGAWQVDPATLAARQGDRETELTRRECDLLRLLAGEPGRIVGRRRLLRELWGFEEPERVETRTVDMHIARLRKKLDAPGNGLIETVRGEGYRLVS